MIRGKLNIVLDSAWGSSGKGKVASWLAKKYNVTHASSSNMPNAGHTVQVGDERTVYKVLPAASHFGATAWLSADSVIDPAQLEKEIGFGKSGPVMIHERAVALQPHHRALEQETLSKISSTMQGSGAALTEKAMRKATLIGGIRSDAFRRAYRNATREGLMLHEVSQGWALSLDHGTHYPHCTSRNCGVGRALDGLGMPAQSIGDVYLVVRTFPIRVGNTEDGYSGDCLADQHELTWEVLADQAGLNADELKAAEKTTVTKRQRRVFTFSDNLVRDAAESNGATKVIITFAEYVDKFMKGRRDPKQMTRNFQMFVDRVQRATDLPVVAVSTGPDVDDMMELT